MSSKTHQTDATRPAVPQVVGQGGLARFLAGPWPLAALLLLALLPYAGVLRNDFAYMYDDKAQIIDNPYVHGFEHWREALTTSVWSHAGAEALNSYYRPMMTLGFLLCYQLFGPWAWGFHLASLLLNAAVVVMLFLFTERLFRDRGAAFATAALFALHPIHVEPVAWISAVTDLQVTFFFLLTFTCFLLVGERRGKAQLGMQMLMALSFVCALLSKEQALMLVLLALIYEHFYRDDRAGTKWPEKAARYGLLVALSAGYILARVFFLGSFAGTRSMHHLTVYEVALSAVALLGRYFAKLLWPVHLSAFYVFHASRSLFAPPVLAGGAALAVCATVFFALWRHARPASFGIVWFLATLAPVLNARWMGPYVQADRYLYLPSVGGCLTAGWALTALWRRAFGQKQTWRWALAAGLGLAAGLCVLRIVTRVPDWQSDVTLISRTLPDEPNEFILRDALGDAYWIRGEEAPAEVEWKEALQSNPTFFRPINALGALYAKQGRYGEAAVYLERAIVLNPDDAVAHLNLGSVYAETGKPDQAEKEFRAAVLLAPMNFTAHNLLGKLYFDSKRLPEAEQQFRQSLQCEPNVAAYDHLGYIYAQWGDRDSAMKAFTDALALNPADSHAHFNLGLIHAAAGQKAQAREDLEAALAADPHNPEILAAIEKLRR